RDVARHRHHSLWIPGQRPARVAAPGAARLPEHVRQTGRDYDARGGHSLRPAGTAIAGIHAIHRWHRADLRGEDLSVLLHHHRVRGHLRGPLADLLGHHAEDDRQRIARLAGGVWVHAPGELRGHHGDDRGLRAAARRVLRGEFAGGYRGGGPRGGGGGHLRLGLSGHGRGP